MCWSSEFIIEAAECGYFIGVYKPYCVCSHFYRENEVEEVKDEGPKEMTLDEWKAMQNKERAKVESNIRKTNEGEDGQWKKGYVRHKSKSKDAGVSAAH